VELVESESDYLVIVKADTKHIKVADYDKYYPSMAPKAPTTKPEEPTTKPEEPVKAEEPKEEEEYKQEPKEEEYKQPKEEEYKQPHAYKVREEGGGGAVMHCACCVCQAAANLLKTDSATPHTPS
jgi:outer membrane biosynthesis protein TonB